SPYGDPRVLHSFPTRRSSDLSPDTAARLFTRPASVAKSSTRHRRPDGSLPEAGVGLLSGACLMVMQSQRGHAFGPLSVPGRILRSEEHTSELQSRENLVCRLL